MRVPYAAALVVLLASSQVWSLPLQGEETNFLQESSGLFPQSDDENTVSAEVNEAIQHDVNMDESDVDIGDSLDVGATASGWEKKAAADINALSRDAVNKAKSEQNDKLSQQFAEDVRQAKRRLQAPKNKVHTESEIERAADKALSDPSKAKKLKLEAEKAEVDLEGGLSIDPMLFIDEKSDEGDDLGEDDDDDSGFALMDGSEEDVAKAINAQISHQVSTQLGSIPDTTGDVDEMKTLAEDKADAEQFLDSKPLNKHKANAKIKAQLAAAQKALQMAQETGAEMDAKEEGNEEKRKE